MSEMATFRAFIENELRYCEDVLRSLEDKRDRRKWEIARRGRLAELIARQLLTFDREN